MQVKLHGLDFLPGVPYHVLLQFEDIPREILLRFLTNLPSDLTYITNNTVANLSGRAGPIACWDCAFDSGPGHGCLLRVLCLVRLSFLQRADPSSRGVLENVCVF